jgi:putative CocE/NonD family hydrolase
MGGWFDLFLKGTIANYLGMKASGGSDAARGLQRLVIGPWAHGPLAGWFPERCFGLMSGTDAADITGIQLRWFDHLLRGEDNGVPDDKPVRIFVMGANSWRDEDDWPLPDTDFVDYHLGGAGRANTAAGDGTLTPGAPGDAATDVYLYDPRNPVPTVGGASFLPGLFIGANAGPRDQRAVEQRGDVLCYSTAPLDAPLEVTGPVEAVLHVSSSAQDTDITAKLVDVAPDGRAESLADGSCGCATGTRSPSRRCWSPGGCTRYGWTWWPRRTCSRPVTGSGWRSRPATSRASTGTPTPGA